MVIIYNLNSQLSQLTNSSLTQSYVTSRIMVAHRYITTFLGEFLITAVPMDAIVEVLLKCRGGVH